MPKRIQRKRTKGWRKPENTVCVSRPSRWGNPWSVKDARDSGLFKPDFCAQIVTNEFRAWLVTNRKSFLEQRELWDQLSVRRQWMLAHLEELRGKDLACWCALDQPCHADVLLELANQEHE